MRELDRIAVVGAGRLGTALAHALRAASLDVEGPLRRDGVPTASVVLLCVPDAAIADAAAALRRPGRLVGHCSGATPLDGLDFSLHPLMTVPAGATPDFAGVTAAVAGDPVAAALADRLGMVAVDVADADRAAYHAAASMASNFLVTLECAAERVAAGAGVGRASLVPLVQATVANWAATGPAALTGPIARGDRATVDRHRAVLDERAPDLLPLYDALATATAAVAR